MRFVILLAIGLVAGCGQPAPAPESSADATAPAVAEETATPIALIHALYADDVNPLDAATVRRFFTDEFAAGLPAPEGEAGVINYDYRYLAQDTEITAFLIEEVASGPEGARVEARFENFGEPTTIAWDLCRRADGQWRITNASNREQGWSLRDSLELPAETAGSC